MAVSSIHIASGANGYFAHNSRERQTVNSIFSDEQNFCSCDNKTAFEIYKSELQKRSEAYTKRTGQKLQAKTVTHLSAIVNFNQEHTEKDIKKVCDYLEKRFDTKVIQYAMHRDEGHIENGQSIKNYHAHIEFMGIDSEGNSIKRQLKRRELIELQTKVAELMKMSRGTNYTADKKHRPKRLDTYEYKEMKKQLAKQKDLQELSKELREQLKDRGAQRADYAQLEADIKTLKERIKEKDLTIENLDEFKAELRRKYIQEGLFKNKIDKDSIIRDLDNALTSTVKSNVELKQISKEAIKLADLSKAEFEREKLELQSSFEKQKKELEEKSNKKLQEKISELTLEKVVQIALEALNKAYEELNDKFNYLKSAYDKLTVENKKLQEALEEEEKSTKHKVSEMRNWRIDELNELKTQITRLSKHIDTPKESLELLELKAQNASLQESNAELLARNKSLENLNKKLKFANQQAQNRGYSR